MIKQLMRYSLGCCMLFSLGACQKYSVSLNDKVIYTPPGIFKDYTLADARLKDCVEQTIIDLHATSPAQITQLNCSNAGIESLAGLEKFYALKALNLADNQLERIDEISKLGQLEILVLSNNQISDATPLLTLLHLKELRLDKNPLADCSVIQQVYTNLATEGIHIQWPAPCKPDSAN